MKFKTTADKMTTFATEYVMQMYINALAKKGVDKVLLIETFEEVNQHALNLLTGKSIIEEKKVEKKDKIKVTKQKKNKDTKTEKKTQVQVVNETEEASLNDKMSKHKCAHVPKTGKNKGKACGKDALPGTTLCKSHTKIEKSETKTDKKTSDKTSDKKKKTSDKKTAEELFDLEEDSTEDTVKKNNPNIDHKIAFKMATYE